HSGVLYRRHRWRDAGGGRRAAGAAGVDERQSGVGRARLPAVAPGVHPRAAGVAVQRERARSERHALALGLLAEDTLSAGGAWSGRRVLVTGATGIVGSWLVGALLERGATVVALVVDRDPQSELVRSGDFD